MIIFTSSVNTVFNKMSFLLIHSLVLEKTGVEVIERRVTLFASKKSSVLVQKVEMRACNYNTHRLVRAIISGDLIWVFPYSHSLRSEVFSQIKIIFYSPSAYPFQLHPNCRIGALIMQYSQHKCVAGAAVS